ncbi:hypothetical protein M2409_000017 [Sphingobacterium sp. JUb21]|nr:hypothetical protein [Sphingobacterium sp. JUb21]
MFLLLCVIYSITAVGQSNGENSKIKVLLLGSYHFSNPGADQFNVNVDDHLSEKRQAQILDVTNSLSKFNPEKIFIESGAKWEKEADEFFQQYKNGNSDINNKAMVSEKFQIGFRLAKQLKNEHIYSVDVSGKWFEEKVKRYADSVGFNFYAEFDRETKLYVDSLNTYFKNHSVKDNLAILNNPAEQLSRNHFVYNYIFPQIGAGDNYIGAELSAEWYKRNLKIYGNILKNVSPTDKAILVIFGNGHIHLLRQLFKDNPQFELVDARLYLN